MWYVYGKHTSLNLVTTSVVNRYAVSDVYERWKTHRSLYSGIFLKIQVNSVPALEGNGNELFLLI